MNTTINSTAPPPSYNATVHQQRLPTLTFLPNMPLPTQPTTFHLTGDSRDPDLILSHPSQPSAPLVTISTDSSLVYHHTHITDHRPGGVMHILKRKSVSSSSKELTYTITTHGRQGVKIIEVTTSPDILSASSTRLIFRRSDNNELDAIRLKTFLPGSAKGKLEQLDMRVEYQGCPIGRISLVAKAEKPVYQFDIDRQGVEPVLFAILATIVDDRLMTTKRRSRRHPFTGLSGVGRGPGAGLGAALAIS